MLLVHIAGWADLGTESPSRDVDKIGHARIKELQECTTAADISQRLFNLEFTHTSSSEDESDSPTLRSGCALRKELKAVSQIATNRGNEELTEVLIIGVAGGNDPTEELARTLVCKLRTVSSEATTIEGTNRIIVRDACILPSLTVSRENAEPLEQEIGGHEGRVLLPVAGGASMVFIEAAGVTAATHPDEWSLILIDHTAADLEKQDIAPIIDMSVQGNPLKGWLMGLGLPTALINNSPNPDEEVLRAAEAVHRVMGESQTPPTPKDYAQIVFTDTARSDLAAGMAIRSWIIAEYRRRLHEYNESHGTNIPDVSVGENGRSIELGTAIKKARKAANPPNDWLTEQSDLNKIGINATHKFDTPGAAGASRHLLDAVKNALGEPPSWLSWPSEQVCLLTGQGTIAPTSERPSIIETLISSQPAPSIRRSCSTPNPLQLNIFIACSDDSTSIGQDIFDAINEGRMNCDPAWSTAVDDETKPFNYGNSTTRDGVFSKDTESTIDRVRTEAINWLSELPVRPRAVIVTNLGEKPIFIALLRAAQEFGAEHGIPTFLTSKENTSPSLQFHQLGLDRDVRKALLEATRYCLDRFDLLSASRLLTLGDPAMNQLSDEAVELAEELIEAVNTNDLDSFAGTVLGAMSITADLIDNLPPDAQARIVTIIAELVNSKEEYHPDDYVQPIVMASNTDDSGVKDIKKESPDRLLGLLKRVRNKLPINHGHMSLADSTRAALGGYLQKQSLTYTDLLRLAIDAVEAEHKVSAGDWGTRLRSLRDSVEALGSKGYGEQL